MRFRRPRGELPIAIAMFAAIATTTVVGVAQIAQAASPENDNIANSTVITRVRFHEAANLSLATAEAADPMCDGTNGRTVWYSFTVPRDMLLEADASTGAHQRATVSAYRGTPGSLDQIACGTTSPFDQTDARIRVEPVSAGETLYFMLGVVGSVTGGKASFTLRQGHLPSNDSFGDATSINSLPFTDQGDSFWATRGGEDPPNTPGCADTPEHSVWYRYTATEATHLRVGAGTNGASELFAYVGDRSDLTVAGCSPWWEMGSYFNLNVSAGETVHFLVDWRDGWNGSIAVSARQLPQAGNDDLRAATPITQRSLPFSQSIDTSGATQQTRDPDCLGSRGTVWYSFTPDYDMRAEASTAGSAYDTTLGVFEESGGVLRTISCRNDNQPPIPVPPVPGSGSGSPSELARFRALAGHTYYLMVGALEAQSILQFSLQEHVAVRMTQGSVTPEGTALVRGSIRCSHPLDVFGYARASQTLASGRVIQAFTEAPDCPGNASAFRLALEPHRGVFRSGVLHIELYQRFSNQGTFGIYSEAQALVDVRLD